MRSRLLGGAEKTTLHERAPAAGPTLTVRLALRAIATVPTPPVALQMSNPRAELLNNTRTENEAPVNAVFAPAATSKPTVRAFAEVTT
jgi:hypothetical protein